MQHKTAWRYMYPYCGRFFLTRRHGYCLVSVAGQSLHTGQFRRAPTACLDLCAVCLPHAVCLPWCLGSMGRGYNARCGCRLGWCERTAAAKTTASLSVRAGMRTVRSGADAEQWTVKSTSPWSRPWISKRSGCCLCFGLLTGLGLAKGAIESLARAPRAVHV